MPKVTVLAGKELRLYTSNLQHLVTSELIVIAITSMPAKAVLSAVAQPGHPKLPMLPSENTKTPNLIRQAHSASTEKHQNFHCGEHVSSLATKFGMAATYLLLPTACLYYTCTP